MARSFFLAGKNNESATILRRRKRRRRFGMDNNNRDRARDELRRFLPQNEFFSTPKPAGQLVDFSIHVNHPHLRNFIKNTFLL